MAVNPPAFIVTREAAVVYKVRGREQPKRTFDWADAAVREWPKGGSISIQSSHGTYAYSWNAIGPGRFLEFLVSLDFDYFMGKAHPDYKVFDYEKTMAGMRRMIIERRGENWGFTKEAARECWDDLKLWGGEYTASADHFLAEILRSSALCKLFDGDYCGLMRYSPDGQTLGFWRDLWPALCETWREELAAAAA